MNLHEIFTEKLSLWEEGLAAAVFLNAFPVNKLAINSCSIKRIQTCVGILQSLPWPYAKEICYEVMRKKYAENTK